MKAQDRAGKILAKLSTRIEHAQDGSSSTCKEPHAMRQAIRSAAHFIVNWSAGGIVIRHALASVRARTQTAGETALDKTWQGNGRGLGQRKATQGSALRREHMATQRMHGSVSVVL